LLGPSLWLDAPGVVLEVPRPHGANDALLRAWGGRVAWMAAAIGWTNTSLTVRTHASGSTLAFSAPSAALMSATSINEWALQTAAEECGVAYDVASLEEERLPLDQAAALEQLRAMIEQERVNPPEDSAPLPSRSIPIAIVTGSNGKTTTTRLIAAMLKAAGHVVGYTCTDGVYIEGEAVERGDWSGPAGARRVLEDARVTAAVLETARGGLLRRGLVVPRADVAVITNVAADHFGEYGIDSLADVAAAKAVVAMALGERGTLILNANDATLAARAKSFEHSPARIEWFGREASSPSLLLPAAEMPITMNGLAAYNIANADAASRAARALGVPLELIAKTLREFGRENSDNPGRLERYELDGKRIWLDYAHNPHGLSALLTLARGSIGSGRLGVLLGQAGDRSDDALRSLARTAWAAAPDYIVLQEMEKYRRGREVGEVTAILRDELLAAGAREEQVSVTESEEQGVDAMFTWARAGDLLVMPVHALDVRERVRARLLR
jgi:cyanophycin synthetase